MINVATLTALFRLTDEYSPAMQRAAAGGSKSARDISDSMKKAGADVEKAMAGAAKSVGTEGGTSGLTGGLGGLKRVLLAVGIAKFANDAMGAAGKITDLSAATGLSVRDLGRLQAVGGPVGVSIDTIARSVQQLQNRLAGGDKGANAAIRGLGLETDRLLAMAPGRMFEEIATAVSRIEDPTKRTHIAMQLFGRGGVELIPLLRLDVKKLGDEAERMGRVMGDDVVGNLDDAGDSLTRFKDVGITLIGSVLSPFLPLLEGVAKGFEWIHANARLAMGPLAAFSDWKTRMKDLGFLGGQPLPEVAGPGGLLPKGPVSSAPADPMEMYDRLKDDFAKQDAALRKATDAAEAHREAVRDLAGEFNRSKLSAEVSKANEAIARLTNKQMNDPVVLDRIAAHAEKLSGEGATLTGRLRDVWIAQKGWADGMPAVHNGLDGITSRLPNLIERLHSYALGITGIVGRVGGIGDVMSNLPGQSVTLSAPKPEPHMSFLQKAFGSGSDFGGGLLNSLMGGGMSGASSFLGGNLGATLAGSLTKGLASTGLQGVLGGALGAALPGLGSMIAPMLTKGIGKLFGGLFGGGEKKEAQGMAKQFAEQMGGLEQLKKLAAEAGVSIDALMSAKKKNVAEAEIKKITAAIEKQQAEQERLNAAVERFGLTWRDMDAAGRMRALSEQGKDLQGTYDLLIAKGYTNYAVTRQMAGANNEWLAAALSSGQKIPAAMRPMLESLIKAHELTDANARALLGLAESGMPHLADIKDAADRYGLSLESLGPKVRQLQITEEAAQVVKDWNTLVAAGADVNVLMGGMKDKVQGFVESALKFGLELPSSMKPMLEQMVRAGVLTDENGNKLKDLSGIKFAEPLTAAVDRLLEKLDELIGTLSGGVESAMERVTRDRQFKWRGEVEVDADGDGLPPYQTGSKPGFTLGTQGQYVDFGRGTDVTLHGRERVVTEAEGAREAAAAAAAGAASDARLAAIERGIKGLPNAIYRAFRDAKLQGAA